MKYQLFHIYMLLLLYFICITGPNEFPEEDPYSNNSNDNDMSEESTTEDEQQADTSISIG
jgi:hypothetical protein